MMPIRSTREYHAIAAAELDRRFRLWLERLGVREVRYAELAAKVKDSHSVG